MSETETSQSKGDPDVVATLGVGKRRGVRKWGARLVVLAVVLAAAAGIAVWRERASAPGAERFVTETVTPGNLRETVTATGTLSPLDSVEIGVEVTGRVTKVLVDVNHAVTKDQVLVELDTEPLDARLDESAAQLRSAQASLGNARATLREAEARAARTKELHSRGLAAEQEVETAEATLDRAKASVSTASAQISLAQANVKTAQTNKSKAIIRSPIDGIVLARSVEVGQTVTSGLQTPVLFTVARDLTQMELRVDVNEADIGKTKEGQRATFVVDAYPRREFTSKVVRLSNLPKVGTTVVTYEAVLTVENPERLLRPGMTATATIVVSEVTGVLTVPNAALRFRPATARPAASAAAARSGIPLPGLGAQPQAMGRQRPKTVAAGERGGRSDGVYVLTAAGGIERKAVEIGATDGRRTEIRSGLAAGANVVTDVLAGGK